MIRPWYLAYNSVVGVDQLAADTIVITGRGNRYHDAFQLARANRVRVLAYWNPFNIPVGTKNPQDLEQFMGDSTKVPRWRFKGTGPVRSNWQGTELADITPGSPWRKFFIMISEKLIRMNKFDGFLMDTMGAAPWAADYDNWPMEEQVAWTTCSVDMSKELWELIQRIAPKFLKIDNNLWDLSPNTHPANAKADEGAQYCSGTCLENPPDVTTKDAAGQTVHTWKPAAYHLAYAKRAIGGPNRVSLLVTPNTPYMLEWLKATPDAFTHVAVIDKALRQSYADIVQLPQAVAKAIGWPPAPTETIETLQAKLAAALASIDQLRADNAAAATQLAATNAALEVSVNRAAELTDAVKVLKDKLAAIHRTSAP